MFTKLISRALIFTPVLLALACSTFTPKAAPAAADIEREEQAVYSFFVGASTGPALILEDTSANISNEDSRKTRKGILSAFKDISPETVDNYLARNEQPGQLSPDMDLGVEYVLLSADELSEITSQPNWGELLTRKYPGSYGYTFFSRVGFNQALDQAVIYVGSMGGPLMGSGFYYLMEKENGEWILKEQYMVWIS